MPNILRSKMSTEVPDILRSKMSTLPSPAVTIPAHRVYYCRDGFLFVVIHTHLLTVSCSGGMGSLVGKAKWKLRIAPKKLLTKNAFSLAQVRQ